MTAACRAAGFAPRDTARGDSLPGMISHVAAGMCVCLVPEQVREGSLPGVTFRTLDDSSQPSTDLMLTVVAATRADHNDPAVRRVLDLLIPHGS